MHLLMPLLIFFSYKYKKICQADRGFEIFLSYRWNLKEKEMKYILFITMDLAVYPFLATNLYSKMHL